MCHFMLSQFSHRGKVGVQNIGATKPVGSWEMRWRVALFKYNWLLLHYISQIPSPHFCEIFHPTQVVGFLSSLKQGTLATQRSRRKKCLYNKCKCFFLTQFSIANNGTNVFNKLIIQITPRNFRNHWKKMDIEKKIVTSENNCSIVKCAPIMFLLFVLNLLWHEFAFLIAALFPCL